MSISAPGVSEMKADWDELSVTYAPDRPIPSRLQQVEARVCQRKRTARRDAEAQRRGGVHVEHRPSELHF